MVSWFSCAVITTLVGWAGGLFLPLYLILLFPSFFLMRLGWQVVISFSGLKVIEKLMVTVFGLIWLMHGLGVLMPETGFDAVWYHLPIVEQFLTLGRIIYLPDYYQSLNPLFSDVLFLLGYQAAGDMGAKVVAYGLALSCMAVSYALARHVLPRHWALATVLFISTYQVMTWQASSFYVDVAKAMWEVASLWLLLQAVDHQSSRHQHTMWSGLFFGASLATKLFSVLLWPVMLLLVWLMTKRWQKVCVFLVTSALVVAPFYLYTFWYAGTPFLSALLHLGRLDEISGGSSGVSYLSERIISFPWSLIQLTLFSRDYVSVLFLALPLAGYDCWQRKADRKLTTLWIFGLAQWLIWWFVPPLSTRYALSGFIVLGICVFWYIKLLFDKKPAWKLPLLTLIAAAIFINLMPRMYVASRQLPYLLGRQTKDVYLRQFFDGNIDHHLQKWHRL